MENFQQKSGPNGSIVVEIAGDVRWEKILALRAVIQTGRYNVHSELIAAKLVETMLESHGRHPVTSAAFMA
jgi:anti-sigma28 factor (negative regulator of flagellin synthesis)